MKKSKTTTRRSVRDQIDYDYLQAELTELRSHIQQNFHLLSSHEMKILEDRGSELLHLLRALEQKRSR